MKVNEDLSVLFWLNRQKSTKDGLIPIYVRITVSGNRDGVFRREKRSTRFKPVEGIQRA